MSEPVNEKMIESALKSTEGMAQLLATGSTTLMAETVNLYLFMAILGVIQCAVVFVVFYVLNKYLNTLDKASQLDEAPLNKRVVSALKTSGLILSVSLFTVYSLPHIEQIGKVLVAPNLFIAEKGLSFIKK